MESDRLEWARLLHLVLDAPGNVLTCSPVVWGADEGVEQGDSLSLDQSLSGQSCRTVPGAVGRGDLTLRAEG